MNEGEGSDSRISSSASDAETIRYRTWPCASCGGDLTPISYLVRCQGADPSFWAASVEVKIATEIQWLKGWVESCTHNRNEFRATELTEGSEHRVYLDEEFHRIAIKCTLPGLFGDRYSLQDGRVWQHACTPYEYLVRLRLWQNLFGFAPRPVGILETGQIVSVQDYVSGSMPSQEKVDEFLTQTGLTAVRKSAWLWKVDDELLPVSTWVGDARPDNFVEYNGQIIPIDLRLWLTFA